MNEISWQLKNAQLELMRRRKAAGVTGRSSVDTSWLQLLENQQPVSPPPAADDCAQSTVPLCPREVTHFPDVGLSVLRQGMDSHYRVWLLARSLDPAGRGWLPLPYLYDQLCGGDDLHLFEQPRLRNLLNEGDGIFWRLDDDRLWLVGVVRLASNLGVESFTRPTINMDVSVLLGRLKRYRAELFASWLTGRRKANPMTQRVIEELTGVVPRTQRRYCRLAKVDINQNIAIGPQWEPAAAQECAWEHGNVFQFIDSQGQQGRKNNVYIAWHLPNSYSRRRRDNGLSKKRRLNLAMKVLEQKSGNLGNSTASLSRRFFHNGKQLSRAITSDSDEYYYHLGKAKTGVGIWAALRT